MEERTRRVKTVQRHSTFGTCSWTNNRAYIYDKVRAVQFVDVLQYRFLDRILSVVISQALIAIIAQARYRLQVILSLLV